MNTEGAFPCEAYGDTGMTLRDYFAAQAVVGFLARGDLLEYDIRAERAYKQADAMLMEREK